MCKTRGVVVTDHKTGSGLNSHIEIAATDAPGSGGAFHEYELKIMAHDGIVAQQNITFQHGPILEAGFNGISNEALLAIVAHRLRCFQSGDYSCRENAIALTKIEEALLWLGKRTRDRIARGVEGTHAV